MMENNEDDLNFNPVIVKNYEITFKEMSIKRTANSVTRKNITSTFSTASNSSIRDSITIQDPPDSAKDAKTPSTSTNERKKFFHPNMTTVSPTDSPFTNRLKKAEQLIFQDLKQL